MEKMLLFLPHYHTSDRVVLCVSRFSVILTVEKRTISETEECDGRLRKRKVEPFSFRLLHPLSPHILLSYYLRVVVVALFGRAMSDTIVFIRKTAF